ncbi:hypothetical protein F2Q69_00058841 [Brassica cretica]|uniref:Uncharacterized protein n=1 Tax=Brassica cretica TaxID=69181 RepID=A0A8S9RKL0_BRACR|nr:hypothetical protein F2Q69_00058841 [Brassica cretica]
MEGSLYRKFSFSRGKGAVSGTRPGVLRSGERGCLLAGTLRPVSCLGSGEIQYLSIFLQQIAPYCLISSSNSGNNLPPGFHATSESKHQDPDTISGSKGKPCILTRPQGPITISKTSGFQLRSPNQSKNLGFLYRLWVPVMIPGFREGPPGPE